MEGDQQITIYELKADVSFDPIYYTLCKLDTENRHQEVSTCINQINEQSYFHSKYFLVSVEM